MSLGWINPEDYSFNSFLFLERFQINMMMQSGSWRLENDQWRHNMGVALNANPAVKWYLEHRCPECAAIISELATNAPVILNSEQVRKSELYALASVQDYITYSNFAHE